jgi:hypothetical protein
MSDDPEVGLRAVHRLAEQVEVRSVRLAREGGWSSEQIGGAPRRRQSNIALAPYDDHRYLEVASILHRQGRQVTATASKRAGEPV